MKNIKEFLNQLNIGYKNRNIFIKMIYNMENLQIIYYFYKKNWIKSYRIINNKIIIYLRYIKNKPLFTKIRFISTSGYRKYLSQKKIYIYKKNVSGHTYILLNTGYGLLSLNMVEKLKIGGEISYILYE